MILSGLATVPLAYSLLIGQKGKVVFLGELDLTGGKVYTFDATQSNQLLDFKPIQSICVDNAVSGVTYVSVSGTGQLIRVPAYKVFIGPIFSSDSPTLTIWSPTAVDQPTRVWVSTAVPTYAGVVWPIDHF